MNASDSTRLDEGRAAAIASDRVLGMLDSLDGNQEDSIIDYIAGRFGDPFDDAGEEIPGLLIAERQFVARVVAYQAHRRRRSSEAFSPRPRGRSGDR